MMKMVKSLFSVNNTERDKEKENIKDNKQNKSKSTKKFKEDGEREGGGEGDRDEDVLETDAAPVDPNQEDSFDQSLVPVSSTNVTPTASADMTQQAIRELTTQNSSALDLVQNNSMSVVNNPMSATHTLNNPQNCNVYQFSHINGLHLGQVYNINNTAHMNNYNQSGSGSGGGGESCQAPAEDCLKKPKKFTKEGKRVKTTTVVDMMTSEEEPNHRMLSTVAGHLGGSWKQVMRDLGFSEGQIEQSIIDNMHHGGIKEVIYKLLLAWIEDADDGKATMSVLTKLLWNSEHYDVVEEMKIVWKQEKKAKNP